MIRYLMTIAYDGSKYSGYQKQNGKRTIQGTIEETLTMINSNNAVKVVASGRTDAGVHALNQKAHFELKKKISTTILQKSLNKLLPDDIYIKDIKVVNSKFHARFNVTKKEYIYKINIGEYNPLEKNYIYQYNQPLDIDKMSKTLKVIEGTHNFRSFTKVEEEKDFVRTIYNTSINIDNNIITINLIGNGFLRYMVRNIVGLLIDIGSGKRDPEEMPIILENQDRKQAGVIAPPQGLYLKDVIYEEKM